jgi:uncharacterized protein
MYLLFYFYLFFLPSQNTPTKYTIHSKKTGDKYTYTVSLPTAYSKSESYPLVLYLDESLNSGVKMQSIAPNMIANGEIPKAILVGIRHHGYNAEKRRRDFIPAHLRKKGTEEYYSDDPKYGQAEKFYQFLDKELLPELKKSYKFNSKTIVGHSLGGLFAVYAMFHSKSPFDNYIAISPSLWANYQNIFVFEEQYYTKSKTISAELYFCCGNYEVLNLVWHNVDLLEDRLNRRKYEGLTFKKKIYAGYNHNEVVTPAIKDGLKRVLN